MLQKRCQLTHGVNLQPGKYGKFWNALHPFHLPNMPGKSGSISSNTQNTSQGLCHASEKGSRADVHTKGQYCKLSVEGGFPQIWPGTFVFAMMNLTQSQEKHGPSA